MQQEAPREKPRKFDPSKLLGFRNLVPVTPADKEIGASSALAFNKIGGGGETA